MVPNPANKDTITTLRSRPHQCTLVSYRFATLVAGTASSGARANRRKVGLSKLLEHLSQAPRHASFSFWLQHIETLLLAVDWPRTGDLQSTQFQAVAQIRESMSALARQHTKDEQLTSFDGALELLELHLQDKLFAPQRPASQVQILGLWKPPALSIHISGSAAWTLTAFRKGPSTTLSFLRA